MTRIPVTPIEKILGTQSQLNTSPPVFAHGALPHVSVQGTPPPIVVQGAASPSVATCLDASGHVVSCSMCKRVTILERALLVVLSAVFASAVTAIVLVRMYRSRKYDIN